MAQVRSYTPKEGYTVIVRRGRDDIKLLEMGILRVAAGGTYRSASEGDELAIVLFSGLANIQAGLGGMLHKAFQYGDTQIYEVQPDPLLASTAPQ